MAEALKIDANFVVMNERFEADIVPVTDALYANLDATYGAFAGHSLISCYQFEKDWPTWEIHPKGDEFVILLRGDCDMVLASDDGDNSVRLNQPGQFVIVPKKTWHTAKVYAPTRMLFVTPGEATENREQPPRGRQ